MRWKPTASVERVRVAVPPASVAPPSGVFPSKNVTVPVGVPFPEAELTAAVSVTFCPYDDGSTDEAIAVSVATWPTTWASAAEVLPAKFASPPYTAVMLWLPIDRNESGRVAWPPPFSVTREPSWVPPSKKVTVPVGVPAPGDWALTVAVNVTPCPYDDGFTDEVTAVLVPAWPTVWASAPEVLGKKF